MQTLLTGFGPFQNVVSNPSERVVEQLMAEPIAGHELILKRLPVSFERAPQILIEALLAGGRDGQPFDNVLMLGLASRSPHWRVERYGRNCDEPITDVDGFTPSARCIIPDAPAVLPVTVPVDAMVDALRQSGLPAEPSDSAGGYLCNHILFRALHLLKQTGLRTRVGFLHGPADEQTFGPDVAATAPSTFVQHRAAVRTVLCTLER